jgi:hypothetical protein
VFNEHHAAFRAMKDAWNADQSCMKSKIVLNIFDRKPERV